MKRQLYIRSKNPDAGKPGCADFLHIPVSEAKAREILNGPGWDEILTKAIVMLIVGLGLFAVLGVVCKFVHWSWSGLLW